VQTWLFNKEEIQKQEKQSVELTTNWRNQHWRNAQAVVNIN